ncbi:unnamed protein product [Sphenostylis stenocarpa]|uniref:Uncharacterized protein n=1 Tax=Sphenostylis stenocarpa TaxID=92480 RepID=A0AA86SHV2_9FABA|nr:unnamed protein product [Sphenostylis stenocarpa]
MARHVHTTFSCMPQNDFWDHQDNGKDQLTNCCVLILTKDKLPKTVATSSFPLSVAGLFGQIPE